MSIRFVLVAVLLALFGCDSVEPQVNVLPEVTFTEPMLVIADGTVIADALQVNFVASKQGEPVTAVSVELFMPDPDQFVPDRFVATWSEQYESGQTQINVGTVLTLPESLTLKRVNSLSESDHVLRVLVNGEAAAGGLLYAEVE